MFPIIPHVSSELISLIINRKKKIKKKSGRTKEERKNKRKGRGKK